MEQPNSSSLQEEEQKNRRRWLLLLLLLLLLITSTIVGFILGRKAGPAPLGQIIDTILLTPEDSSHDAGNPEAQATFHLSGRVFYSNGTPAAGHTLELHSDPVTAVTDSKGGFLFANVPEGEHTIAVLNRDGSIAARRDVDVVRSSDSQAVSLNLQDDGKYTIELSIDVRVLEIEIELGTGELYINPEFSYATADGSVITPSGAALFQDGVTVTPAGNIYLADGNVVFPGGSKEDPTYILQPDNTVIIDRGMVSGDIIVDPDGTVSLPDGTVIEPGGLISPPENKNDPPESSSPDDSSQPVQDPSQETNPDSSPRPEEPSGGASSAPSSPDPSEDDDPVLPPVTDEGSLQVSAENKDGGFTHWQQHCMIDLFYNRSTGQTETIAPGSSGYYLFQLKNTRKKNVTVTLSIAEEDGSPHIPLRFSLRPQDQETGAASGTLTEDDTLSLQARIESGADIVYQLDWEWPYDSGSDEVDTEAGSQGGAYILRLMISAEETD